MPIVQSVPGLLLSLHSQAEYKALEARVGNREVSVGIQPLPKGVWARAFVRPGTALCAGLSCCRGAVIACLAQQRPAGSRAAKSSAPLAGI